MSFRMVPMGDNISTEEEDPVQEPDEKADFNPLLDFVKFAILIVILVLIGLTYNVVSNSGVIVSHTKDPNNIYLNLTIKDTLLVSTMISESAIFSNGFYIGSVFIYDAPGTITIVGNTDIQNNMTVKDTLLVPTIISDTATFSNGFYIGSVFVYDAPGTITMVGNAEIKNNMTIRDSLMVPTIISDKAIFNDGFYIGSVHIYDAPGTVTLVGNENITNDLIVNGNTYLDTLFVNGDENITENLIVNGNTYLNALFMNGNENIIGDLTVNSNTYLNSLLVNDNLTVNGNTKLDTLIVNGNENIINNLTVNGNTKLDTLSVGGNMDLSGSIIISGNETVNNENIIRDLTVNGNTYLNTLFVNGTKVVNGINGRDGTNGTNGRDGKDGSNSINGTSLIQTGISPLHISSSGQISIQVANSTEGGYLTQTDWVSFNSRLNVTDVKSLLRAPNQRYVDFLSGSDVTGDGSQFYPWQSLQHAYNSITPTFNIPYTLFVSGQYDIADTTTIIAKPNVNLFGLSGQPVIPFDFIIIGGGVNDVTYFSNLVIQGNITWIRNDIYGISLYLFNVAMNGLINFQQQGAGRSGSFLDASISFISGFTVQAGQVTLSACQGYGKFTYLDSGSNIYCLFQGGNYYESSFNFSGGIQVQFSGILSDVGDSIITYTTASGTPNIVTDSSSIPLIVSGPYTLTLTSQANHINYPPTYSSNWTSQFGVVPSTVGQALDLIGQITSIKNMYVVDAVNGNDVTGTGSYNSPYKTLQKAANTVGTATSNAIFNDPNQSFYNVKLFGTTTETNVTFGTRPHIVLDMTSGVLNGDVTIQFDQNAISGANNQQPRFTIQGGDLRPAYLGIFGYSGINGNLNYYIISAQTSLIYQIDLINTGITGNVITIGNGVGGAPIGLFCTGCQISGKVISNASPITLYANNADTSGGHAIGGATGVVQLYQMHNVRFTGAVVVSGAYGGGRWFDVQFLSSLTHDFSAVTGSVSIDANTFDSWNTNVPIKGLISLLLLDNANGINYVSTNPTAWTNNFGGSAPVNVSQALDLIATGYLNGIFKDNVFTVVNSIDTTKKVMLSALGNSASTTTIVTNSSSNRVIMTPDYNSILIAASTDTSTLGQVFIGANASLPYAPGGTPSNAGLQYSSNILNRGSIRVNQYGNNAGIPGITTFKSRGTNVGDMVGVSDLDVIFRVTAEGATGNLATPLSALISINVPTGGTANPVFIATEYELQLVSLDSTATNQRRIVYKINSEGTPMLRETAAFSGQTFPSGIAILAAGTPVQVTVANARIVANSRVMLTVQPNVGSVPPVGIIYVATISAGVGFTIASTSGADMGQNIYYQIYIPL